jgi:hypothetical protein
MDRGDEMMMHFMQEEENVIADEEYHLTTCPSATPSRRVEQYCSHSWRLKIWEKEGQ